MQDIDDPRGCLCRLSVAFTKMVKIQTVLILFSGLFQRSLQTTIYDNHSPTLPLYRTLEKVSTSPFPSESIENSNIVHTSENIESSISYATVVENYQSEVIAHLRSEKEDLFDFSHLIQKAEAESTDDIDLETLYIERLKALGSSRSVRDIAPVSHHVNMSAAFIKELDALDEYMINVTLLEVIIHFIIFTC